MLAINLKFSADHFSTFCFSQVTREMETKDQKFQSLIKVNYIPLYFFKLWLLFKQQYIYSVNGPLTRFETIKIIRMHLARFLQYNCSWLLITIK
jgi:hypothetical protein